MAAPAQGVSPWSGGGRQEQPGSACHGPLPSPSALRLTVATATPPLLHTRPLPPHRDLHSDRAKSVELSCTQAARATTVLRHPTSGGDQTSAAVTTTREGPLSHSRPLAPLLLGSSEWEVLFPSFLLRGALPHLHQIMPLAFYFLWKSPLGLLCYILQSSVLKR